MDSSSEGSFAWADASDDSSDSDNNNMAKSKLSMTQSGEESESGLGYKKKLQQQLFSPQGETGGEAPVARGKRKLPPEPTQPRKKIKLEPDSNAERTPNQRKPSPSTHRYSSDEQYDDNFLDQKVKSEQSFAVPSTVKSKKNKKKSVSAEDCNSADIEVNASTCLGTNGFLDESGRSDSYVAESSSILDRDEIEHHSKTKKKKKKKESRHRSPISSETGDCEETLSASEIDSPRDPRPGESGTPRTPRTPPAPHLTNGARSAAPADISFDKRKSRISERIRFEDDEDTDVPMKDLDASAKSAQGGDSKLKSYVGSHGYLRRLAACPAAPRAGDDVWVVRAPRDVPLDAFLGVRWPLAARTKLKLAGHSYEGGAVDAAPAVLALAGARGSRLRRVLPAASLRLRRRLPEARAADEAPPERRAFIPLPDTKCRHPLLGAHYKKALRLPEAAAARLRRRPAPADPEPEPKKKKKKRKRSERGVDDQHAWDSEKAIEQNLFNF